MRLCRAFTIVELLVVLVIVSLLSATALVMVRLPLRNAEIELAFEQIRSIDSLARAQSAKGRPVVLRMLPAEKRLVLRAQSGSLISLLNLPRHAFISRVLVLNQEKSDAMVELQYANQTSPTFAVMLGKTGGPQSWLLFCGLSGESYRFDKEEGDRVIAGLVAQNRNLVD